TFSVVTILAVWGASIVGAVYMLRAIRAMLQGPLPEHWSQISDASNPWRRLPFAILLAGLLTFGFFPRLLTDKLAPSVTDIVARFSVSATAAVSLHEPAFATGLGSVLPFRRGEGRGEGSRSGFIAPIRSLIETPQEASTPASALTAQ